MLHKFYKNIKNAINYSETLMVTIKHTFNAYRHYFAYDYLRTENIIFSQTGYTCNQTFTSLCLFASFDPQGIIQPYLIRYLQQLSQLDIEIIFVSTSPTFRNEEIKKIFLFCSKIILRKNTGHDFGSWATAIKLLQNEKIDFSRYKNILIANDSLYGPLFDLRPIFDKMEKMNVDFWAMTESFEIKYHLQSYFIVFNRSLILNPSWINFWKDYKLYQNKRSIIYFGEITLSQYLIRKGFKSAVAFPINELLSKLQNTQNKNSLKGIPTTQVYYNPVIYLWDLLLEQLSFPFIKRELFVNNKIYPLTLAHDKWKETVINAGSKFPTELISQHLKLQNNKPSNYKIK
ncbi:MAG: hypothetical protein HQK53_12490 [Oligoflexia bacterium]|nr:hypothetical protein [Oligoflexia bacterium]